MTFYVRYASSTDDSDEIFGFLCMRHDKESLLM